MNTRSLLVPEGLDGERVDVALSRALGLSRTAAAQIAEDGGVEQDGAPMGKSDRVLAGSRLDVVLPEPARPLEIVAEPVPGMSIIHEDEAIIVVDKPVGVAAHSAAAGRPHRIGGLAAAGHTIATSERRSCGIVSRLDVGTRARSSRRASTRTRPQARLSEHRPKTYHALVQACWTVVGTMTRRSGATPPRRPLRAAATVRRRHALPGARGVPVRESARDDLETGRDAPDPHHMSATKHPCCGDLPTTRIPCWRRGWDSSGSGCTRCAWASSIRVRRVRRVREPYRRISSTLDVLGSDQGPGAGAAGTHDRVKGSTR